MVPERDPKVDPKPDPLWGAQMLRNTRNSTGFGVFWPLRGVQFWDHFWINFGTNSVTTEFPNFSAFTGRATIKLKFMHRPTPESFHKLSFHKLSGPTFSRKFMQDGDRKPFHKLSFYEFHEKFMPAANALETFHKLSFA